MKAVGEVMGIGRSFQEALHKATQSLGDFNKVWIDHFWESIPLDKPLDYDPS